MNFALGWDYILLSKERLISQKNTEALCQRIRYSKGDRQLLLWNTSLKSGSNHKNKSFRSTSTVDGERFVKLNIDVFSAIEVVTKYFCISLAISTYYLV